MASLPSDGFDDLLFEMYKKQVLKLLISKMPPDMSRTLHRINDGGPGTSDLGDCKSRLESFLASFVAREDVHTSADSELSLGGVNSRLESMFGSVLSMEVLSGIVGIFALRCSETPRMHEEFEKLVVDLLKFLVDSCCIKLDDCVVITPPMKRKHVTGRSPAAPAKRVAPRGNHTEQLDAKVLFPEVQEPTKDDGDVIILKEVRLNERLNQICNSSDALYNENNVVGSKVDGGGATTLKNAQSPSLSIVSEDRCNAAGCVSIPESARFRLTPGEKLAYKAVCSLAHGKLARSTVVDIGGCILRYFSLGESMAAGNEVCTYVVNALCRKFFMDERPTVSKKHYFFCFVAEVFLSDSTDYSYVQKTFNGAGSVLPLPLCDSFFFPVMFEKHWFLFVVDLKNKYFLLLDSYYSKDEEFSIRTRKKLKEGFCHAWGLFVGPNERFSEFRTAYPRVPKQDNKVDCGIFMIKFMELWWFGCNMCDTFSQQDIPSIRVQILNDLVFCKHNSADINVVKNYSGLGGSRV